MLVTLKKLEANRRNALKSTGPATPRGRAVSSQNGRKHKLLPFENPALPAQLAAQYYGYFLPANKEERRLVDIMIHCDRMRRHFLSLRTRVRASEIAYVQTRSMPDALAAASLDAAKSAQRNARQLLNVIRKRAA